MSDLAVRESIPAMSEAAIDKVRQLELERIRMQQVVIDTDHVIHAGVYARTIMIPAGVLLTGALIKVATTIIVHGDVIVYIGDVAKDLRGYNVLPASANRKQAFLAKTDTYLTMLFATDAKTVQEAEEQFTDEHDKLFSRADAERNTITITGE